MSKFYAIFIGRLGRLFLKGEGSINHILGKKNFQVTEKHHSSALWILETFKFLWQQEFRSHSFGTVF